MQHCHRRDFLKFSAGFLGAALLPLPALATTQVNQGGRRTVSLYNTHTHETFSACYYDQGSYQPQVLAQVNHILRDHRIGKTIAMDTRLLDQLYALTCRIRPQTPFHIISGYRSPETNAKLRRKSSGVASTSLHTVGRAIDIRLPGYGSDRLAKACITMKAGGVGCYTKSNFVHIDTGRVRAW